MGGFKDYRPAEDGGAGMSECVVRMEVPQNCWVCPFGSDRFIWDENNGRPHYVMVRFCSRHSGEEFHVLEIDTIDRPWYCDSFVCRLPDGHGRLVDADDMKRNHMFYHEADNVSYAEERDIDETPTIVPADAPDAVTPTDTPTDMPTVPAERSEK